MKQFNIDAEAIFYLEIIQLILNGILEQLEGSNLRAVEISEELISKEKFEFENHSLKIDLKKFEKRINCIILFKDSYKAKESYSYYQNIFFNNVKLVNGKEIEISIDNITPPIFNMY